VALRLHPERRDSMLSWPRPWIGLGCVHVASRVPEPSSLEPRPRGRKRTGFLLPSYKVPGEACDWPAPVT
jgi:hypothetical protein